VTFIENEVNIGVDQPRYDHANDQSREVMYGIPWIMIESFTKTDTGRDVLEIKICGPLKFLVTYGRFRTTDPHICNCSSLI
jgi:hypothetical protein